MNLVLLNNMDPEFKKSILKFKKTARDRGIQEGSKLKYPSPLIVKQYAKDLISVLNSIKKDSIEIECCFEDLEDFIDDSIEKLEDDYKKNLLGYRANWDKEKEKVDNIVERIISEIP